MNLVNSAAPPRSYLILRPQMRREAGFCLLPLLFATCNCFATSSLITGDAVGELVIGKAPPAVKGPRLVFRRWEEDENGKRYEALRLKVAGVEVDAEVYDGSVWRIWIEKPGLVTLDGVGVGASAASLLRKNSTIHPVIGPGPSLVLIPAKPCGISYITDFELTDSISDNPNREAVSPMIRNARISKIIAVGCKK